ncbi:MAG: PKD-like family lipoprotein [Chitinophagaceae bacterium]
MKYNNIVIAGLLSLLAAACNKDDSTGATSLIPPVSVTGLKDTFNVFTHKDFITVNPVVRNENEFDYYWTLFSSSFTPGQGLVKADTLARTRDLNYEVLQNPGAYILVFNVRDRKSEVTTMFKMTVNITTLTMNGWYLVKDNAGKTDMDFIHNTGRIDNWIANFNGQSLDGNAIKAVFAPAFKISPASPALFNTLAVVSENDAAIYRIDNGAMVMNYDNMFFTKPTTRKPQSIFQPMAQQNLTMINNGQAYNLVKGTLFSNFPVNTNNLVYNNLSPITAVGAMGLGWSTSRKSAFCFDGSNFVELKTTNGGNRLQNMNADLKWMTGYAGSRSVALMLFRNPQDTGYLFKLNVQYGPLIGSGALVMATDTLKPEHGLMHADAIGGNYDIDLVYYSVGDKVYMMDVATATETEQFTLPPGETVTCIQHIKYPQATAGIPNTLNYIAIATYNAGRYKVYLHTISGTGTLAALPQANFEGEGRVSTVIYMEQGNGSRVY